MNRLESAVRAVMRARNLANLTDAAVQIGLQKSALSKILLGQIGLSPTNLRKLVTGISQDPEHQFSILRAHLFDEAERSGFPLPLIEINYSGGKSAAAITFADLPAELQTTLRTIADEIKGGDDGLRAALDWIGAAASQSRGFQLVDQEPLRFEVAESKSDEPSPEIRSLASATTSALQAELRRREAAKATH